MTTAKSLPKCKLVYAILTLFRQGVGVEMRIDEK